MEAIYSEGELIGSVHRSPALAKLGEASWRAYAVNGKIESFQTRRDAEDWLIRLAMRARTW